MIRRGLANLSLDELAQNFEILCIEQFHSLEREEISQYNRRHKKILSVEAELKSRIGDQRRILQRFFGHSNAQVRLTAAHANLAIDYERARAVLEQISADFVGIQKLDAGMTLLNLDRGIYRPT